jgi:hypothetical protein
MGGAEVFQGSDRFGSVWWREREKVSEASRVVTGVTGVRAGPGGVVNDTQESYGDPGAPAPKCSSVAV